MTVAAPGERPDAGELLEVARETLLGDLLPRLDAQGRYQALMIANAMAIAARELAADAQNVEAELAALRGLYETSGGGDDPPEPAEQALARLEARLARDLRAGVLDGGPQFAVRRWLRARLEARVAVSNPRALAGLRRGERGP